MLAKLMSQYWWVLLLRGVFAIVFGILALGYPGMTIVSFVYIFAAFAFVDGVSNLFHAFSGRSENQSWWVLLLEGLLGIAIGIITFQAPEITALVLLLYIGFWALASGVFRIILAVRLRDEIEGEWWMVVSGLVSVLFGLAIISRPASGALAVLTFIGLWSVVAGVILVLFSFKVKAVGGNLEAIRERLGTRGSTTAV